MSTAEDLIRSHEGPSAAHHLSFSQTKKGKNETCIIYCSDQSQEDIHIHNRGHTH